MNHRIRFATKEDFLYACVVLAMFVATAVGLFGDLSKRQYDDSQSTSPELARIGRDLLGTTGEHLGHALAGSIYVCRIGGRGNLEPQFDPIEQTSVQGSPHLGTPFSGDSAAPAQSC